VNACPLVSDPKVVSGDHLKAHGAAESGIELTCSWRTDVRQLQNRQPLENGD
jgi:hypothetical protein